MFVERDADEARFRRKGREETVVKTGAATESSAVEVERETGDENKVERVGGKKARRVGARFPNPESAGFKVGETEGAFRSEGVAIGKFGVGGSGVRGDETRGGQPIKFEFATDAARRGDDAVRAFEKARKERADRRFKAEIEVNGERASGGEVGEAFQVAENGGGDGEAVESEGAEAGFHRLAGVAFGGGDRRVGGNERGGWTSHRARKGKGGRKGRREGENDAFIIRDARLLKSGGTERFT